MTLLMNRIKRKPYPHCTKQAWRPSQTKKSNRSNFIRSFFLRVIFVAVSLVHLAHHCWLYVHSLACRYAYAQGPVVPDNGDANCAACCAANSIFHQPPAPPPALLARVSWLLVAGTLSSLHGSLVLVNDPSGEGQWGDCEAA